MNCSFETIATNLHKCVNCGKEIRLNKDPKRIIRRCSTKQMPNLGERAVNFTHSMIEWAKSGFQTVSEEEKARRLEICSGNQDKGIPKCEKFVDGKCSSCGCVCNWKTWLETSRCPLDKW